MNQKKKPHRKLVPKLYYLGKKARHGLEEVHASAPCVSRYLVREDLLARLEVDESGQDLGESGFGHLVRLRDLIDEDKLLYGLDA